MDLNEIFIPSSSPRVNYQCHVFVIDPRRPTPLILSAGFVNLSTTNPHILKLSGILPLTMSARILPFSYCNLSLIDKFVLCYRRAEHSLLLRLYHFWLFEKI